MTLIGWLAALPGPVTVVMEATLYWAWLHQRLTTAGYAALVAHPYQVNLIWQARCKTDPIDARKLAELARTNLLPTIWGRYRQTGQSVHVGTSIARVIEREINKGTWKERVRLGTPSVPLWYS